MATAQSVDTSLLECDPALGGVMRCHVVQTEPQREFAALLAIASLPGLKPWLPTEVNRRFALRNGRPVYQHGHRVKEETLRPLFRGYILVWCDPTSSAWAPLFRRNRETCTVQLFCDPQHRPLALPQPYVEALQARGRAGDGAIDPEATLPPLSAGSRVRLSGGPLEGVEALVQSSDLRRAVILMGMLRMTIDRNELELVG